MSISIAAVVGIILGALAVITGVDSVAAAANSSSKQNAINDTAREIALQLAADEAAVAKLKQAVEESDTNAIRDIFYANPTGTAFNKMAETLKENRTKREQVKAEEQRLEKARNKSNAEIEYARARSQTSGSIIGDLISGSATYNPQENLNKAKEGIKENAKI